MEGRREGPSSNKLHSLHVRAAVFSRMWSVQIYRCVHMLAHCAKYLIQVDRQSGRQPGTVWAAIVVQQLASQGRTHQVEHKSPLIRDSQVPLEWSAQQPITLLSWLAWNWLFYCKSYPAKGGRFQALSGWILGTDTGALGWKQQLQRVNFRNSLEPSRFLLIKTESDGQTI